MRGFYCVHQLADLTFARDIHVESAATDGFSDPGCVGVVNIGHRDELRPFRCETASKSLTDTGSAAGDDNDFSSELHTTGYS